MATGRAHGKIGSRRARALAAASACGLLLTAASGFAADPVASESSEAALEAAVVDADSQVDALFDEEFDLQPAGFPDPFETPNRVVLGFNQVVDLVVLDPVTRIYRFVLPDPVRRALNRFFDNLNSSQVLVNDMLQLEWHDAWTCTARLGINSTLGLAGFFDPASSLGFERHTSDFGQTLALSGAPSGTYLILPLLGPTTVRDGIGLGVDALLHPTFYAMGGYDLVFFSGTAGLTARARHFEELKALKESSIDFYASLRSGYYQNRVGGIWSRREHRRPAGAP